MKEHKKKALVLGDDPRSTLAVVRSLGRYGVEVWVGVQGRESIVSSSRYAAKIIQFPSTDAFRTLWEQKLKKILQENEFDLVIPSTDSTFLPLFEGREHFSPFAKLALPDEYGFDLTYHKEKTFELAEGLGIPIPQYHLIKKEEDFDSAIKYFSAFPVVMKPAVSKLWMGDYRLDLGVLVVETPEQLKILKNNFLPFASVILQQYVSGVGVGQEFLAKDGEIIYAFEHRRIHEPEGSGGSSYRKSVSLSSELFECSRKLVYALRWNGVLMIEYRVDPKAGYFWLIEINGRFWGSLPLALAAGADFPKMLFQFSENEVIRGEQKYTEGISGRNLTGDLRWLLNEAKQRGIFAGTFFVLKETVFSFLRLVSLREHIDTFSVDDPAPFFKEVRFFILSIGNRFYTTLSEIFFTKYHALRFVSSRRSARVKKLLTENPHILFLCQGNIIRSPFAEGYLLKRSKEEQSIRLKIFSAGVYNFSSRESPPFAKAIAREYGISLENHRSKPFGVEDLKSAGAVFCMDRREYETVRRAFPWARKKIFMLGAFHPSHSLCAIKDPWGRDIQAYRDAFRLIAESIDEIILWLEDKSIGFLG